MNCSWLLNVGSASEPSPGFLASAAEGTVSQPQPGRGPGSLAPGGEQELSSQALSKDLCTSPSLQTVRSPTWGAAGSDRPYSRGEAPHIPGQSVERVCAPLASSAPVCGSGTTQRGWRAWKHREAERRREAGQVRGGG